MTISKTATVAALLFLMTAAGAGSALAHGKDHQGGWQMTHPQMMAPNAYMRGACPQWGQNWGMGCPMMGQGMMGPGMMDPGMMGPGMMGQGMMGQGMMGPGMMGQGMMGQGMMGHGMMHWGAPDKALEVDDVRRFFEHRLQWRGNPRLKLGEIKETGEDSVTVDIVTLDGSLVEKFEVDRRSGFIRPVR